MPALYRAAREQKVQYFQDAHPDCRTTRLGGSPENIALSARARARKSAGIHDCQLFQMIKVGKNTLDVQAFITVSQSQINFHYCT